MPLSQMIHIKHAEICHVAHRHHDCIQPCIQPSEPVVPGVLFWWQSSGDLSVYKTAQHSSKMCLPLRHAFLWRNCAYLVGLGSWVTESLTLSGGRANTRISLYLLFLFPGVSIFILSSISQCVNTGRERILVLLYGSSNKTVGSFQPSSKSQSLQAHNN